MNSAYPSGYNDEWIDIIMINDIKTSWIVIWVVIQRYQVIIMDWYHTD